jgi:hypothetical protein
MDAGLLGFLATAFGVVGGVDYVARIFGRTLFGWRAVAPTHPRAATWVVWSAVGLLIASAYTSSGAHETAWSAWALTIEFVLIAFFAMVYDSREGRVKPLSTWHRALQDIDATEWKCLAGAAVAGAFWLGSGEPALALLGGYAVDLFAAWPTIRQARRAPTEEPYSAWLLTVVGNVFNLLAVPNWSLATIESIAVWSYPIYMTTVNGSILGLLTRRQLALSKAG